MLRTARPSTLLLFGLLLLLAWQLRAVLIPAAGVLVPWIVAQPAAVLLLLLAAIAWRAKHPTAQVRSR
jgi:hypothetical protein